ncbi:MAG: VOC family protein, partial [Bryobacteraceae bacterium]
MIAIQDLFESHLTVSDLDRAIEFYRDALRLPLASVIPERRVAFFWVGARGKAMLGVWETGKGPQKMTHHVAFRVDGNDLEAVPQSLRAAGIAPLDFHGRPAEEPVVLTWMPAAAVYFRDPDGNLLEFLAMLP